MSTTDLTEADVLRYMNGGLFLSTELTQSYDGFFISKYNHNPMDLAAIGSSGCVSGLETFNTLCSIELCINDLWEIIKYYVYELLVAPINMLNFMNWQGKIIDATLGWFNVPKYFKNFGNVIFPIVLATKTS